MGAAADGMSKHYSDVTRVLVTDRNQFRFRKIASRCRTGPQGYGGSRGRRATRPMAVPKALKPLFDPLQTMESVSIMSMALHGRNRLLWAVCTLSPPKIPFGPPQTSFGPLQNIPPDPSSRRAVASRQIVHRSTPSTPRLPRRAHADSDLHSNADGIGRTGIPNEPRDVTIGAHADFSGGWSVLGRRSGGSCGIYVVAALKWLI